MQDVRAARELASPSARRREEVALWQLQGRALLYYGTLISPERLSHRRPSLGPSQPIISCRAGKAPQSVLHSQGKPCKVEAADPGGPGTSVGGQEPVTWCPQSAGDHGTDCESCALG